MEEPGPRHRIPGALVLFVSIVHSGNLSFDLTAIHLVCVSGQVRKLLETLFSWSVKLEAGFFYKMGPMTRLEGMVYTQDHPPSDAS